MYLYQFLTQNNMSITDFGNRIGYTREYISRIMTGKMKAGKGIKMAIAIATTGNVSPNELITPTKETKNASKKKTRKRRVRSN